MKGRAVPEPTPREALASVEHITAVLNRTATRWTEAGLCPPPPDPEGFLASYPPGERLFNWSGILQAGLPPLPDDRPLMRMVCAKQWVIMSLAMMVRGHVADPHRVPEKHITQSMTILAEEVCDSIQDADAARGTLDMLMEEIRIAAADFDGWFNGRHLSGGMR